MTDCALEGLRLSGVVDLSSGMARTYFVYILANRSRTLYVGVTNNLIEASNPDWEDLAESWFAQ
jgi:hypothetical protein